MAGVYVLAPTEAAHLDAERNASGMWRVHDGNRYRLAFYDKKYAINHAKRNGYPLVAKAIWNESLKINEYSDTVVINLYE